MGGRSLRRSKRAWWRLPNNLPARRSLLGARRILRALFSIALAMAVAGCRAGSSSRAVVFYYTLSASSHGIGVLQWFSAEGRPLRSLNLGPVGLTGWTSVVSSDGGANLAATTGYAVKMVDRSGAVRTLPNPDPPHPVVEVRWLGGELYAVTAKGAGGRLWRWGKDGWHPIASLPQGLPVLLSWEAHPVVILVQARGVTVIEEGRRLDIPGVVAAGSAAVSGSQVLIPFTPTLGPDRPGLLTVDLPRGRWQARYYPDLAHSPWMVTPTHPPWAAEAQGLAPFDSQRGDFGPVVRWPRALLGRLAVVGRGAGWILVLAGATRGYWFDVSDGRFGPGFQVALPPGAVVRGASLVAFP